MIDPRFVLVGAALSVLGSLWYAARTVRGETRPNRVTWGLWAATPLIGFGAQLDAGVGWPTVLTLAIGVGPAIILAASFVNPASYWRLTRFDLGCGAVSALALVAWLSLEDPVVAVVLAVLADLVAGVPTMLKSWRAPESENPVAFALGGTNGVITLLTVDDAAPEAWAFAAYIALLGCSLATVIVLRGRRLSPGGPVRRAQR